MSEAATQTLNPIDAHQALAAVITMYTGIIADHHRERSLLLLQNAQLRAQIKELQKPEPKEPPEPVTTFGNIAKETP
jgi:hypothetical protein